MLNFQGVAIESAFVISFDDIFAVVTFCDFLKASTSDITWFLPEEEQPKANGHTKTNMKSESYWVNGPQKYPFRDEIYLEHVQKTNR